METKNSKILLQSPEKNELELPWPLKWSQQTNPNPNNENFDEPCEDELERSKRESPTTEKGLLDNLANSASQLMPPWLSQAIQNADANMVLGTYQAMVIPMRSTANMTGVLMRPIIQGIQGLIPGG